LDRPEDSHFRSGRWVDYSQASKVAPIEALVASQKAVGGRECMRSDQKIRCDAAAWTATSSVSTPSLRGPDGYLSRHG
jgi:hypothetical protein